MCSDATAARLEIRLEQNTQKTAATKLGAPDAPRQFDARPLSTD
jgi:hypothetical protein